MSSVQTLPASSADASALPDWAGLSSTKTLAQLGTTWLDHLSVQVPQASRCLMLVRGERDELRLTAVRPAGIDVKDLTAALTQASRLLQPGSIELAAGARLLTAPLIWGDRLVGLVALQLPDATRMAAAMRLLSWGCGWLVATLARGSADAERQSLAEARKLLDLVTSVLSEAEFDAAALAIANRLSTLWQANGVTIGWIDQQHMDIVARANASDSDERANLLHVATAAMDEALDLRRSVQWPAACDARDPETVNLPEHRRYAREVGAEQVATALLFDDGIAVGAVLLERDRPFTAEEIERLDTQCMMIAPLLVARRDAGRSLVEHARASVREAGQRLTDDSRLGWKFGGGALAALLVLSAIIPIPFRIAAPAVVEGEVQRAAVAPFKGFIREARARAGDTVRAGQVLALLEDKDLQLDRVRSQADLEIALRKEREAMAAGNRIDLRLAGAQADQARAQLALAVEKINRAQIVAPFDGVIVRGDLSQQLGSPVELGSLLFELAPLDAWRVILKVDERDVAHLRGVQHGELVLSGLSGVRHRFTVERVTAVAVAEEGRNHFRAEARLEQGVQNLRPGMEGIAKVNAGSASALWVWTRRFTEWLRLTIWEWSP